MTIQEVIDRIFAYHPEIPDYANKQGACDGVKCGDTSQECTGIVTSVAASSEVIRKAHAMGANLIVVHEPTFFSHMDTRDWLEENPVYLAKLALCEETGVVIVRDHDHIHAHMPDGIYTGVAKELGWLEYQKNKEEQRPRDFILPPKTVRELAMEIKEKRGLNGVRVIGNLDAVVSKVRLGGHILFDEKAATEEFVRDDIDVLMPLECIDWTTASFAREAGQLGFNKAMILVGHMNGEELGMKYAAAWIGELVEHQIPITYVQSGDMYQYL